MLLIHGGALGDFVLALHAACALCKLLGAGQLAALCRSPFARYAVSRGALSASIDLEAPRWSALFTEAAALDPELIRELAGAGPVLSMLGGPECAVARQLQAACKGPLACIDPRVRPQTLRRRCHIATQWLEDAAAQFGVDSARDGLLSNESWRMGFAVHGLLETVDGRNAAPRLDPFRPRGSRDAASAGLAGRRIIIHPGSGGGRKCWPLEWFILLGRRLAAEGGEVHFMLGPVERETLDRASMAKIESAAPIIAEEKVCRAAAVVDAGDVYIGNDAGMTHVAAALGVPTVATFTATDPQVWRPIGPSVYTVDLRHPDSQAAASHGLAARSADATSHEDATSGEDVTSGEDATSDEDVTTGEDAISGEEATTGQDATTRQDATTGEDASFGTAATSGAGAVPGAQDSSGMEVEARFNLAGVLREIRRIDAASP